MAEIKIDNAKQFSDFDRFLRLHENHRIIFSGIFGTGKTTFLQDYFQKHKEYISFHIFPTNYSVSTNEDIFELIKFDILYNIVAKYNPPLETLRGSMTEMLSFLDAKDYYGIFKGFIESIPDIGKFVTPIIGQIEKIYNIISEKQKVIEFDEGKIVESFVRKIENSKGSIYDNDFYTCLIEQLIQRISPGDSGKKEVVLVVDDLDRIDPEHIFRILNIFAVHFDLKKHRENSNKFGIDKVIICCDIENIRRIFKSRYGADVDFNGYIDKFYSHHIFNFDNRDIVSKIVKNIFQSIRFYEDGNDLRFPYPDLVVNILTSMIYSGTLNLRTILRWQNIEWHLPKVKIAIVNTEAHSYSGTLVLLITFLIDITNNIDNLTGIISKTNFTPYSDSGLTRRFLGEMILLADVDNHGFYVPEPSDSAPRLLELIVDNCKYHYELMAQEERSHLIYYVVIKGIASSATSRQLKDQFTEVSLGYKDLLIKSLKAYKRFKIE